MIPKKQLFKRVMTIQKLFRPLLFSSLLAILISGPMVSTGYAVITPNDVYGLFDLADRNLDNILRRSGATFSRATPLIEKGLKPMHVYQMAVSSIKAIHNFQLKNDMIPIPIIIATSRDYKPGDVYLLGEMVVAEVSRIARHKGVRGIDTQLNRFTGKTPTHVFSKVVSVYLKINQLGGAKQITPSDVFAQMYRARNDVKSILGKIDPARRYRVDVAKSPPGLTPLDVIKETLKARGKINKARRHFGLAPISVPMLEPGVKIFPADVFIQTQIIIAEINLLKIATGTISATPLPIPVKGKTPSDVHQEAVAMEYLLDQIDMLEQLVKTMESK